MNFHKLPFEIQCYIVDYLLYPCCICKHKFYDSFIKRCFDCNKYVCEDDCFKQINSVLCEKCFYKKYETYIEDIADLFNNCMLC